MSETTLWNQSLAAFRDATASAEPTPGGGSVAMVGATLGLGLVIMALEITQRKPEPGTETDLADLLARARTLLNALSRHADEDVTVFRAYMDALKLPKQSEEEKTARKKTLQEALVSATRAPLTAARDAAAALDVAERSATLAGVRVVSDVGAGAALLGGAIAAVLLNVDINLPGVGDVARKEAFHRERTALAEAGGILTTGILAKVAARITSGQ